MTHPIVARLHSVDPLERRNACRDSVSDPSAALLVPALAEALGDAVLEVAREASEALTRLAREVDGVPAVVRDALRSEIPSQRWFAALTCARIEPAGPRLLAPAVEALASHHAEVRWSAARLLVDAGRTQPEVFPLVLGLARNGDDPRVRRMAISCIRELAPERPESELALLAACRDSARFVRHAALTALAALTDPSQKVFAGLMVALMDPNDPSGRALAALALGALGVEHRILLRQTAEPALRQLASGDTDDALRHTVEGVLQRLDRQPQGISETAGAKF